MVGIGLRIDSQYENEEEWAILYHGTKSEHLQSILENGLRPGKGQAFKGTSDPWGKQVPIGVYLSFWLNQSFTYTNP